MSALPTHRVATENWTPPADGDWTVDLFMRLENPPGFRYELVEGHLLMSPSPNFSHQTAVGILFELMSAYVRRRRLGVVLVAPFDVIPIPDDDTTALQPDILFISNANRSIIHKTHALGPPDLVVEAISPKREALDRDRKFRLYAQSGVKEYWILDPPNRKIQIWVRRGESLVDRGHFGPGSQAPCEVIEGFTVSVEEVFSEQ